MPRCNDSRGDRAAPSRVGVEYSGPAMRPSIGPSTAAAYNPGRVWIATPSYAVTPILGYDSVDVHSWLQCVHSCSSQPPG